MHTALRRASAADELALTTDCAMGVYVNTCIHIRVSIYDELYGYFIIVADVLVSRESSSEQLQTTSKSTRESERILSYRRVSSRSEVSRW